MTFPTTPRDVRAEMYLNGHWTDVTTDVYGHTRSNIEITRGRSDEGGTAEPSSCGFILNNRSGKYSPRNPVGAYFGQIGRNTEFRTRLGPDGVAGNFVGNSTFETDVTGWQAYGFGYGGGSVAQSAVQAWQGTKSALVTWPTAGVGVTSFIGTAVELVVGRQYTLSLYAYVPTTNPDVRATLGFTSSSSYMTTKNAWTRITHTFTATAATASYAVGIESRDNTTAGQICYIDGVMVQEGPSASAFTSTLATFYPRFHGEITSLPPRWDTSGNDAFVPIVAKGLLRRNNQGTQPVNSGLKQYLMSTTPITYWPLDDGATATSGAPAANSTFRDSGFFKFPPYVVITFGNGILADFMPASLRINDTVPAAGGGFVLGHCTGSDTTPDALAWEFVYRGLPVDADTEPNMSAWFFDATIEGSTAGTYDQWEMRFRRGGNDDIQLVLTLDTFAASPTVVTLADSAALEAITDGELHHVRLHLVQSGANVDYAVYVDGAAVISGTRNTHTLRRSRDVSVLYDRLATEDLLAFGHLIVWENAANIPAIAITSTAGLGFAGERAGVRFERLCGEVDVPFVSIGDLTDTLAMGLQYTDYFSNQLAEIEATDFGMIYEPRDALAIGYRTRATMYSQTPAATIVYSAHELDPPFEPVDDDQGVRNNIFAQRRDGSSYEVALTTGALSVNAPPAGVGRYKDEVAVNVQTDAMLPEVAGWLLVRGTVDEARYPQVRVRLESRHVTGNPTLAAALLNVDVGDRIVITAADAANIYDDISLIVYGYVEVINAFEHTLTFNCGPAFPFDNVLELDAAEARVDPDGGSTLNEDLDTTETGVDVASNGFLWTTAGGDMPISIMVGGEEMTVSAISGASSPQTFTVTRSVNGVVKTHTTGAEVALKKPGLVAL